jgi:two-component system chemotaxis response regulator CheY
MNHHARILVVDDFPLMRRILRNELRDIGFTHVEVAENGAIGLEKARIGRFDLVIADWNMPEMDGLAMLRKMRQDIVLQNMPVLMVTGEARRDSIVAAARAGASGYIVKPFSASTLENKISRILARCTVGQFGWQHDAPAHPAPAPRLPRAAMQAPALIPA